MREPTIIYACLNTEIKLTESLAGLLIEPTRYKYKQRLAVTSPSRIL